jgi:HEAT repeat protein
LPKSKSQLREQLSAIEPDEHTYEGIGPPEVDALVALLEDDEEWLAARAVHALGRIDSEEARRAVVAATDSPRMEVRVASAASAEALPAPVSDEILSRLLDDPEPAVRKFAIKATSGRSGEVIKRRIDEIADSDADARLRRIAHQQADSIAQGH